MGVFFWISALEVDKLPSFCRVCVSSVSVLYKAGSRSPFWISCITAEIIFYLCIYLVRSYANQSEKANIDARIQVSRWKEDEDEKRARERSRNETSW